ncbi:kinase-like domain-containing protein [Mycena metata]|uniref:Kinase-like domain-containing protein n=1 Tax=Mycena metata TaxID=1033252 RepID=A0AAD7NLC8_9AGAR|nr:kinase-like domain-containing protein [Mycena metata]
MGPYPAFITPFCQSGSIMKFLGDAPKSPQECLLFVSGIAQGLAFLHAEGVVHGNLTTKKILVDETGIPVISGYGLANASGPSDVNTVIPPPARFTPPEYFINDPALKTTGGDVYSLSMIILEVISGLQPYHHLLHEHNVLVHILPGGRPTRSGLDPLLVSDRLWGLLQQLWNHQPGLRPDMNRVVLAVQSLSESKTRNSDSTETKAGSSTLHSGTDFSVNTEEEIYFGHPCLADINSEDFQGRLSRTDEYPCAGGGNSNIYRGYFVHTNGLKILVAIKFMRVYNDGSGQLEELRRRLKREAEIWNKLNHRNVIPFLGVWHEPAAPFPALICPFYKSGNLQQYLRVCPTADKEQMILGVSSGVEYLHRHDIVHGDLKVHNVLVDKNGVPCLCDFGISKILNSQGFSTSSVGTAPYMAPELFLVVGTTGDETLDRASTSKRTDMYSLALLVLEILTTKLEHRPSHAVLAAQALSSLRPRRSDYQSVDSAVWNFLESCWEPDPNLRPTVCDFILRMPLDTSETRIMAQFSKVPSLSPPVEVLCGIIQDCHMLPYNRCAARQLANRCHRFLLELLEQYTDGKGIQQNVHGATECLLEIRTTVSGWTRRMLSRIQSILKQNEVAAAIKYCHSLLSRCSVWFQLIPHLEHLELHENLHFDSNNREDHQQALEFLAAIQNAHIIVQELLVAQRSDVTQLVSMMQKLLGENSINRDGPLHRGLSVNLFRLKHEVLTNYHLHPGEVVRISDFPSPGSTMALDIYEGLYLASEKVEIKVVRALQSSEDSLRRFRRQCEVWAVVWEVDQGKHILPFYGSCHNDGPFPYNISPWQPNGNALHYVKNRREIDYIRLIQGIASGIEVMHTMIPPVIHGNIKASSIYIAQDGRPLLADFEMSRVLENAVEIPFTQSRGVPDSYRWFAPEVCIGRGVLSLASDIYSYGMTVLELLTHEQPHNQIKHTTEVVIRAARGEQPPRPASQEVSERGLDDKLWVLLRRCWAGEPSQRPTIQDILTSIQSSDIAGDEPADMLL